MIRAGKKLRLFGPARELAQEAARVAPAPRPGTVFHLTLDLERDPRAKQFLELARLLASRQEFTGSGLVVERRPIPEATDRLLAILGSLGLDVGKITRELAAEDAARAGRDPVFEAGMNLLRAAGAIAGAPAGAVDELEGRARARNL